MFVDFNRVFKNKTQTQLSVPNVFIDYMNRSLPTGVKYVIDSDGHCVITSTTESCNIGGFKFVPTEEQKKILGKNFTHQDILDYFYNIQKPIPLVLDKDGYILLNGQEFPVEKMAFNPFAPIKYISGSFHMYPQKFPEPFPIKIGCNKYERILLVKRIPNDSVSIAAFESDKEAPFYIQYFIDSKKQTLKLNVSFNISKAKTIRDIVESTSIYNAFLDGKGTFLGRALDVKLDSSSSKRFDDNSILFWEKVLQIEEHLATSFVPPQEDVDFDTICLVEQLYQNLINRLPTRSRKLINSIDGNWDFNSPQKGIKDAIGHPIFFECEVTSRIELFGAILELPTLLCIFNSVLKEYPQKGKKQKLIFVDESEEKKRYISGMCFKTEGKLKEYKTINHNKMITLFHDAKMPHEYL